MIAVANPQQAAPWLRGLEAAAEHENFKAVRIEGRLPAGLRGTLYRNGPGQNEVFGTRNGHWFDGDGMIAAFSFDDTGVRFSNRFVRTKFYEKEQKAGRMLYGGFATPAPSPFPVHLVRGLKNPANTNVVYHAGRLLALWEGGRPWAVDADSLATIGEEDFEGGMPGGTFFLAHPHRDGQTGDLINVGPVMGRKPAVQPWRIDARGRAEKLARIAIDKAFMTHDFGLTASKIVLLGGPFYLEPKRMFGYLRGTRTIYDCFQWHGDEAMTVYVADRQGRQPVRRYELPTALLFHIANAFDDGDDVVVDCVLYSDDGALQIVQDAFQGVTPTSEPGALNRLRLKPNGSFTRERLWDGGIEFTRIDDRRDARPYTVTYGLVFEKNAFASDKLVKIQIGGNALTHAFGAGCYAGEPVFAPRPGSEKEDDGWVCSLVYDSNTHTSFLAVIDTQRFGKEDTRVHLPFHIPIGFHGNFRPG